MKFDELNIISPILKALHEKKYTEPTAIQEQTIPLILQGHDVLGCAQTGTGKTAAFAIPIIQQLLEQPKQNSKKKTIKALIITPTRELAIQIGENIEDYSKFTPLKHTVIFGGVKQGQQVQQLNKGIDVLVATPGRLLDLINQGFIKLNAIEIFVLDEADRMLDMGFINDINRVLKLIPKQRQSLFFSATMPDNILHLSKKILHQPKKVEVSPVSSTAETIQQFVYYTNRSDKKNLLIHLIEENNMDQVLIFAKTKYGADKIVTFFKKNKVNAAAIHGDKSQNQRQKALSSFKAGELKALVATDIAARGIDIQKLKYVINFDIPDVAETYIHRIGRSGRAGEEGIAISISEPEDNAFVKEVEKLSQVKIKVISEHPYPQTDKPMTAQEKKELNKEKERKKREFFANRKKGKNNRGRR